MAQIGRDSFGVCRDIDVGNHSYRFFSLKAAEAAGIGPVSRLPVSLKILLENLLRHEDGEAVDAGQIRFIGSWAQRRAEPGGAAAEGGDVSFHPVRVLMPDVSGIPLLGDLAAMRDACAALGGAPHLEPCETARPVGLRKLTGPSLRGRGSDAPPPRPAAPPRPARDPSAQPRPGSPRRWPGPAPAQGPAPPPAVSVSSSVTSSIDRLRAGGQSARPRAPGPGRGRGPARAGAAGGVLHPGDWGGAAAAGRE